MSSFPGVLEPFSVTSNRLKPLDPVTCCCGAALESRLHFTATIMRRIIVSTGYLYIQVSFCFIKLILFLRKGNAGLTGWLPGGTLDVVLLQTHIFKRQ